MFSKRSLGGLFQALLLTVAVWSLCSARSWSDTVSFSESQKDTLKCVKNGPCNTFTTGKFTMKGMFFTDVDLTQYIDLLATDTELDITIGDWLGGGQLGDDPKYHNGGTKATINLVDTSSCTSGQVTHGSIKFSASLRGVSITVSTKTGSTGCDDYEDSAIADEDAGDSGSVTNTVGVSIALSNGTTHLNTNLNVNVVGSASVKTVIKNGETNDLNSVKVSGSD